MVRPRCTTVPSALSCACQIGRKKLTFSSTVVKDSSAAKDACKRHPHCRIGNITKNSAVQRSHGICMLRSGCQHNRSAPISDVLCLKSDQTRDGHLVDPCSPPKVEFQRNSLSTHELRAPLLNFRARTLVSRYSSR